MNEDIPISSAETLHDALANGQNEIWSPAGKPNENIVVFLHGFASTPWQYDGVLESVAESTGSDVYAPEYDAGLYSDAAPGAITTELAEDFNGLAARYQRIHFIAHSMGTAFLRSAFLEGLGSKEKHTPLQERLADERVRMTFLAGSIRGYTPTDWRQSLRLGLLRRWFWLTLAAIAVAWSVRSLLRHWGLGTADEAITLNLRFIGVAIGFSLFQSAVNWILGEREFWSAKFGSAAWTAWAFGGWPVAYFAAMAFTGMFAISAARLFAVHRRDRVFLPSAVVGLGVSAPWLAAHPQWAYPAFLLTLIPLFLYPMRSRLLLEHVLYGAPWITGVRLRWMEAFAQKGPNSVGLKPPPIVHLFGEEDRLVGDDDHVELHQSERTVEIALRGVTHNDFLISGRELEATAKREGQPKNRRERMQPNVLEAVRWAVTESHEEIRRRMDRREGPTIKAFGRETTIPGFRLVEPLAESKKVRVFAEARDSSADEHLVFLVHGIRDFAEWQDSLAAKFEDVAQAKSLKLIDVVQVRYGYFSALQFLLSGERERATRAFVDLYTQTKARHPHAVCHAAAHSNGTYVVANALKDHGYIKLNQVYLCGSVLSPKFEWPGLVGGRVRSDRAMQDWPVGVLCRLSSWVGRIPLVGVHYKLLGTGGIDGFRKLHDAEGNQVVFENAYLPGGHGEALRPKYHDEIANFVLTGEPAGTGHVTSPVKDVKGLRGRMIATLVGLAIAAAAFALPAVFGPACAAWGIVVGALTLLLVLRVGMAV